MASVALVGPDGSGKTTLARALVADPPVPLKYLYMGFNIESSNVALPWSRLHLRLKLASYRREAERKGIVDPGFVSTHHNAHRTIRRGRVMSALRMINRLAESAYRQVWSWMYQREGYVVLYDRHFLFDSAGSNRQMSDRVYSWVARRAFPKPDVVLFLDAPAEVLLARKGEGDLDYLSRKRNACVVAGASVDRFISVDANRPIDAVLADIRHHIEDVARTGG